MSLTVSARLNVPASPQVTGLVALPGGERVLCSGSRWLVLNAQGEVQRAAALNAPCLGLSLSPAGTRFLTFTTSEITVWSVGGQVLRRFPLGGVVGAGFQDEQVVLAGSPQGITRLNLSSEAGDTLRSGAVNALFVAPDGKKLVVSDGQRVQLLAVPSMQVQSGYRCENTCTVQNANFSASGRMAVAFAGGTLIGLRENMPATTILRNAEQAAGLPQPDNTVLTFSSGKVESRDFQTGRREQELLASSVLPGPALQVGGRVLALTSKGELLDADPNFSDVKRLPLPGTVQAGGLDASGQVYGLTGGVLSLTGQKIPGTFWAVQTMNKFTWALRSDSEGGLQVGLLSGEKFTPIPGSPRTAIRLSVNHWGNAAAVWDDETLWVASQAQNKISATVKLSGKARNITLSPDATRAFVLPEQGSPLVITLADGKSSPFPLSGSGTTDLQISGSGVQAVLDAQGNLNVSRPKTTTAAFTVPAVAPGPRFSPDGKWLAAVTTGPQGTTLNLLNVETGKIESTSDPLASLPTFLAWSADSKKLAVGASLLSELSSATVFEIR